MLYRQQIQQAKALEQRQKWMQVLPQCAASVDEPMKGSVNA